MSTPLIKVVLSPDKSTRQAMAEVLAMRYGFARSRGDARKIMAVTVDESILYEQPFFVLCYDYDLRAMPHVTQKLFQMATAGICVIVGCRTVPSAYALLCEVFTAAELL